MQQASKPGCEGPRPSCPGGATRRTSSRPRMRRCHCSPAEQARRAWLGRGAEGQRATARNKGALRGSNQHGHCAQHVQQSSMFKCSRIQEPAHWRIESDRRNRKTPETPTPTHIIILSDHQDVMLCQSDSQTRRLSTDAFRHSGRAGIATYLARGQEGTRAGGRERATG